MRLAFNHPALSPGLPDSLCHWLCRGRIQQSSSVVCSCQPQAAAAPRRRRQDCEVNGRPGPARSDPRLGRRPPLFCRPQIFNPEHRAAVSRPEYPAGAIRPPYLASVRLSPGPISGHSSLSPLLGERAES